MKPRKKRVAGPPKAVPRQLWLARGRIALAAPALIGLLWLAYSNSFSAGFVLDNDGLLLKDPRIREFTGANLHLIFQHTYWWPTAEAGLYRPLTTLSYLFNYAILGNAGQPAGYHWINFLLHTANVLLVYVLMRRTIRELWPSFFAAALWAVHPVLTESVTNMIGRSDLLAATALLSGLWMYLKSTESSRWRGTAWLTGLLAVTAAGVFSKESAVAIVPVIGFYELTFWRKRTQARRLALGSFAVLVPILAMLYQRSHVLAASPPAELPFIDNPIAGADFWTGWLTAIKVITRYLSLVFWPATLSSDYSYSQIPLAHGSAHDWFAAIAVLAMAMLAVLLFWWNRVAFLWVSFAIVTFAPMSNLLFPIGTIMAERFLYLPAVGLLACLVQAIYAAAARRRSPRLAPIVLGLITAAFAMRTWVRNEDWQNDLTMAEATASASPNSFKAHRLLASALYEQNAKANLDRILTEADKSLALLDLLPDSRNAPEAYRTAGGYYLAKGDALLESNSPESASAYQRALHLLLRSVSIDAAVREAYERHGAAEWTRLHADEVPINPGDPEAQWMLAAAYLHLGNPDEASAMAGKALALHPLNPAAYRVIAAAFVNQRRIDNAATALIEGILITSDFHLMADLVHLYQDSAGPGSCAIANGPQGPDINPKCELVRREFCSAAVEALKAAVQSARLDVARLQKQKFLQSYGCPAGPLNQVLPD